MKFTLAEIGDFSAGSVDGISAPAPKLNKTLKMKKKVTGNPVSSVSKVQSTGTVGEDFVPTKQDLELHNQALSLVKKVQLIKKKPVLSAALVTAHDKHKETLHTMAAKDHPKKQVNASRKFDLTQKVKFKEKHITEKEGSK